MLVVLTAATKYFEEFKNFEFAKIEFVKIKMAPNSDNYTSSKIIFTRPFFKKENQFNRFDLYQSELNYVLSKH